MSRNQTKSKPAPVATSNVDPARSLLLWRCMPQDRAGKTVRLLPDGNVEQVSGYSTGMMFFPGRVAIPVANLADLHEFIVKVAGSQQHFVTLGRAVGDTEGPWRRLKFEGGDH